MTPIENVRAELQSILLNINDPDLVRENVALFITNSLDINRIDIGDMIDIPNWESEPKLSAIELFRCAIDDLKCELDETLSMI